MARRIESLYVPGPDGPLEALLEEPDPGPVREVALVCHPHPLHGGTMRNKVVHRLARGLRAGGCATLRFNFRGVLGSAGVYDNGRGEQDDARSALGWLRERYPGLGVTVAGFSFGSRVAAQVAEGARRVILVGFPTVYGEFAMLDRCRGRRIFIQSTRDEFGPRAELQMVYERLWQPKEIHWVEASDHFFSDALEEFEAVVEALG
jgi:alpha/beta superfamily hydrolase